MDGPLSLSARALEKSMCITGMICMDICRYLYLYTRMCVCVFVFTRVRCVCACMCACAVCVCVCVRVDGWVCLGWEGGGGRKRERVLYF